MLIISQQEWTAADLSPLAEHVSDAVAVFRARSLDDDAVPLLLLPLAEPSQDLPDWPALAAELGRIAAAEKAFLAGAAAVHDPDAGAAVSVGFVIDADGEVVSRYAKISPDLVAGFRDGVTCAWARRRNSLSRRRPSARRACWSAKIFCSPTMPAA